MPARHGIAFVQLVVAVLFLASCAGPRQRTISQPRQPAVAPPVQAPVPAPALPPLPKPEPAPSTVGVTSGNPLVTVRLFHGVTALEIQTSAEFQIDAAGQQTRLPPGRWRFAPTQTTPAVQRFHVFTKTFRPGEESTMYEYMAYWKVKGYDAEPVLRGDRYAAAEGVVLDGRQYWVSLARAMTAAQAQQIVKRLEALDTWAWVRAETVQQGSGSVSVTGQSLSTLALPVSIRCDKPVSLQADSGKGQFSGVIEIVVEPDSFLGVYETLPMEDYLAGVLPAEMPAAWPFEALKAQAVTARSDILEHLGLKHILEGYHFTNGEGDRVYTGFGGRLPSTDSAVAATRGQVLVSNGRIVPAVFSANCGGWTENNENVWSSPPIPALRGVSDKSDRLDKSDPSNGISAWLVRRPPAYCSADEKGYRWTRRYTAAQLDGFVNQKYPIGHVTAIEAGDRGVSGRLKWVNVRGTKGSAVVRKELPIRQAFGDLPSSMLIIKEERGPAGDTVWIFTGGGRGHGVGLCQHGARGMALEGKRYDAIVAHYFSGSTLATVQQ